MPEEQEKNKKIEFTDSPPSGDISTGPDESTKLFFFKELNTFKDSLLSSFIGIFGLFAALVTFLGLSVGILSNLQDINQAIGLILILLGGVLVIILAAHMFQKELDWKRLGVVMILILISMLSGVFLLTKSSDLISEMQKQEGVVKEDTSTTTIGSPVVK